METGLISSGIFGISEASRLLGISPTRLRHWVQNPRTSAIISRDIPSIEHRIALSFVNLIEAHFINQFSKWGLHVSSIRAMAARARDLLEHPHPFATAHLFKGDGRTIFMQTYNETGDPKLYDLRKNNWAMPPIVERELKAEVVYGPSGLASIWYPRKATAPNVAVNPKVAFGSPSLDRSGVPTIALYDAVQAAGGDIDSIAKWYDVPKTMVRQAVKFEKEFHALH